MKKNLFKISALILWGTITATHAVVLFPQDIDGGNTSLLGSDGSEENFWKKHQKPFKFGQSELAPLPMFWSDFASESEAKNNLLTMPTAKSEVGFVPTEQQRTFRYQQQSPEIQTPVLLRPLVEVSVEAISAFAEPTKRALGLMNHHSPMGPGNRNYDPRRVAVVPEISAGTFMVAVGLGLAGIRRLLNR